MILNQNTLELIAGAIACLAFMYFGWWMYRQLGKSGYKEFKGEDEK